MGDDTKILEPEITSSIEPIAMPKSSIHTTDPINTELKPHKIVTTIEKHKHIFPRFGRFRFLESFSVI